VAGETGLVVVCGKS